MECERAQELYVDHLAGRLDTATGRDVRSHITGCALCRAETDRLAEMWSALGELPAPVVDAGRVERVSRLADAAAMRRASRAPELVPAPRRAAIVATLAVAASAAAFVAGLRLGGRTDPIDRDTAASVAASVASSPAGERWMLLLLETPPARPVSDAEMRDRVAEYGAWARQLASDGRLVMAEKLADVATPRVLSRERAAARTGHGAAPLVGGFFLIQADSVTAERIASECPHLKYGGAIELRRVEAT